MNLNSEFSRHHQSVVMLIAALTATDKISAKEGAAALVLLGTIQVALAMPEQIMGVIKNFILKTGDKTQAPDFAMTAAELDLKQELAVGLEKKLQGAKQLVSKVMDLKPHMLAGQVEEVCSELDKHALPGANVLQISKDLFEWILKFCAFVQPGVQVHSDGQGAHGGV